MTAPQLVRDVSGFAERLKDALGNRGDSHVARALGVAPQTLYGWKNGAMPAADKALALADALEVNERWLITGQGQRSRGGESGGGDSGWISLPRYDLFRFEADLMPEPVEQVRIRRDWISRAVRPTGEMWVAELPSDGMPDVGREGDLVLCESMTPPLVDGRVYIFLLDRQPIVRRVQLRPEGLVLKAGDPGIDPITIAGDRIETLLPVGRVLASISLQAV